MEPRFNSSFIPKAPLAGESSELPKKKRGKRGSVVPLVSGIVFIIAIAATGGLMLYEQVMVSGITNKVEQLEDIQARIDPNLISELGRYASRLEGAKVLLDEHLAPSFLQDLLSGAILATDMRFESLEYIRQSSNSLTLSLRGQASDLESVVLQSDALNELSVTRELYISDIVLEKSELSGDTIGVSFSARTKLVPEAMRFRTVFPVERAGTQDGGSSVPRDASQEPNGSAQVVDGVGSPEEVQNEETSAPTGATVEESFEPL